MNLSVNSFSAGVSCLKSNKAPAFKGVLSYESEIERARRALDARHISAITSEEDGKAVRFTFLEQNAQPLEYGTKTRSLVDYVDVPYEKAIKAYAKALAENGVVKI